MEHLPPEVLIHIFSFLVVADLNALRRTYHRFDKVIDKNSNLYRSDRKRNVRLTFKDDDTSIVEVSQWMILKFKSFFCCEVVFDSYGYWDEEPRPDATVLINQTMERCIHLMMKGWNTGQLILEGKISSWEFEIVQPFLPCERLSLIDCTFNLTKCDAHSILHSTIGQLEIMNRDTHLGVNLDDEIFRRAGNWSLFLDLGCGVTITEGQFMNVIRRRDILSFYLSPANSLSEEVISRSIKLLLLGRGRKKVLLRLSQTNDYGRKSWDWKAIMNSIGGEVARIGTVYIFKYGYVDVRVAFNMYRKDECVGIDIEAF